ncbi:unnamed protein product [Ilex paraguariensis]|uniref:Uncharacterized protein n=1 Tax=Ilex paraguariensis TaxID=185542 RepID=A0ABC8SVU9_9AQUA
MKLVCCTPGSSDYEKESFQTERGSNLQPCALFFGRLQQQHVVLSTCKDNIHWSIILVHKLLGPTD